MSRFRITILTLQNEKLTFHVDEYLISDGDFIEFTDKRTGSRKKFHASRCEIEEAEVDGNAGN